MFWSECCILFFTFNAFAMFGLMKNTGCLSRNQPEWYRLHYCGVCKSIGSRYGQRSRTTLNYDTVFLAEILSLLSEEDSTGWNHKLRGYRCFDLPEKEHLPLSLQYAADINILLAEVKLKDNISDEGPSLWPLAGRFFKRQFGKVHEYLQKWQVDEELLRDWLKENQKLESTPLPGHINSAEKALRYYATPTAELTAYCFSKGAAAIGKEEWKETLRQFGYHFGALIYGLDAIKDLEKDAVAGDFNPLLKVMDRGKQPDSRVLLDEATAFLWGLSSRMTTLIDTFPFSQADREGLQGRLMFNLSRSLSVPATACQAIQTGIEKSSFPRFMTKLRISLNYVFSFLNPAKPARFAWTYLLFLFLFFNNQLMAGVELVIRTTPVRFDWAFWLGAATFPVIAWAIARRIKKGKLIEWLEKQQAKLKKKIAELKEKKKMDGWDWAAIILIGLLLIFIIIVVVAINQAGKACGESCSEEECSENSWCGG
jgi:hypothetical protein